MRIEEIAKLYASTIYTMGKENNFSVVSDLSKIQELIYSCNDLENLLFLDIFTQEEKNSVILDLLKRIEISDLVTRLVSFLLNEKRIKLLPFIYKEVVLIEDEEKGFIHGKIKGSAQSIPSEDQRIIEGYLKNKLNKNPILKYEQDKEITCGYKIESGDYLLDATLDHQLERLKQSILGV
jgi:F-type H+-transporting ATPase subunit delta